MLISRLYRQHLIRKTLFRRYHNGQHNEHNDDRIVIRTSSFITGIGWAIGMYNEQKDFEIMPIFFMVGYGSCVCWSKLCSTIFTKAIGMGISKLQALFSII